MRRTAKHRIVLRELFIPREMHEDHERKGGRQLRRWIGRTEDGLFIRVMHGLEPAGKGGKTVRHVSVSIARSQDVLAEPCRLPTDEEFEAATAPAFYNHPREEFPNPPQTLIRHAWTPE
jgi:hypothetical protein